MTVDQLRVGQRVVWERREPVETKGRRVTKWSDPQHIRCKVVGLPKREGGLIVVDVPGWGRRHVDAKHLRPATQEEPCRSRPTK